MQGPIYYVLFGKFYLIEDHYFLPLLTVSVMHYLRHNQMGIFLALWRYTNWAIIIIIVFTRQVTSATF